MHKLLLHIASSVIASQNDSVDEQSDRGNMLIQEARSYVQTHFSEPVTLTRVADYLKISTFYLSHLFSRETGFTLSSYLTQIRMDEAVRLLSDPTYKIEEVAYAVGFENPNYFGKVFRKIFYQSPSQFRKLHDKKSL